MDQIFFTIELKSPMPIYYMQWFQSKLNRVAPDIRPVGYPAGRISGVTLFLIYFRAWYGLGQTYELLKMPYYCLYYYKQVSQHFLILCTSLLCLVQPGTDLRIIKSAIIRAVSFRAGNFFFFWFFCFVWGGG